MKNPSYRTKWTRESLINYDHQLGQILYMLQKNKSRMSPLNHKYQSPSRMCASQGKSQNSNTSDVDTAANESCYSECVREVSEVPTVGDSVVDTNVYYESACPELNLQEELDTTNGLLVLHEENGRYRCVGDLIGLFYELIME